MVLLQRYLDRNHDIVDLFQFPLHREWFCYERERQVANKLRLTFSSLFIGSGSVTALVALVVAQELAFSSLFIGSGSVTIAPRNSPAYLHILSVPSS